MRARPAGQSGRPGGPAVLAAIVIGAIAVRVALVGWADAAGFDWIDPDRYLDQGRLLAAGNVVESFRYTEGFFKAPLHTVFLGACALFPDSYPDNAIYVQAVFGGLSVLPLFALVRRVSTDGIALAAAAAYAIYFPAVVSLIAVRQEHVYVPLLLVSFAALAKAVEAGGRVMAMAGAGAAFGLAALTRSMPIYFVPAAAILLAARPGRSGRGAGVGLLGGFALVVVPFVVWISLRVGHVVLIENIGSYGLARLSDEGRAYFGDATPTLLSTAAFIWSRFAAAPLSYAHDLFVTLTAMFRVPGGPWLAELTFLAGTLTSLAAKIAAHVTGDGIFIAVVALAPLGLVSRRAAPVVQVLGLWMAMHLLLTLLSGYGGQRFREPLDFALITLAGAGLAGSWRPLTVLRGAVAAAAFLPMATGAFPSIQASLRARVPHRAESAVVTARAAFEGGRAAARQPADLRC